MLEAGNFSVAEGAQAAEDRLTLVRMEWEEHRHRLFLLVLLLIFSGALVLVALLLLSIALLVWWVGPLLAVNEHKFWADATARLNVDIKNESGALA